MAESVCLIQTLSAAAASELLHASGPLERWAVARTAMPDIRPAGIVPKLQAIRAVERSTFDGIETETSTGQANDSSPMAWAYPLIAAGIVTLHELRTTYTFADVAQIVEAHNEYQESRQA